MEVNLTKERLHEMLQHVAASDGDRVVYEFRKDEDGDLDKIVDITDHVDELESDL